MDIGCGWGTLAIEIVKQTGCHCTGITLSKQQLKYAKKRVQDLGLQVISLSYAPILLLSIVVWVR